MASDKSSVSGVAGRYALALFELAKDAGELDLVASDLAGLQAMLDESDDFARLVYSPEFSADEQLSALNAVLERSGLSSLSVNFLRLVTTNRRLMVVSDMIKAYGVLLASHRGEVVAEVASATALDEAQNQSLRDALKAVIGQDVQINTKVDPSLLGGLVVKVGSRMIDSSIKTKLNNLKVAMKEVG